MSQPVCAIVGAGEGLGRSLAAKFAGEGFDIALISRSEKGSRAAAEDASTANPDARVRFLSADATQPQTIEQTISAVAREMGEVQVLNLQRARQLHPVRPPGHDLRTTR